MTTPRTFSNDAHKYKKNPWYYQRSIVARAFSRQPRTMKQVSIRTGIDRANICRMIAKWRRTGAIRLIRTGLCPITRHRAGFYMMRPREGRDNG